MSLQLLLNIIILPVLNMHWSWRSIDFFYTDLTGVQYLAANEIRMINECFMTSGVQYRPVDCTQYHLFLHYLPLNSKLIVVDAKARTKKTIV